MTLPVLGSVGGVRLESKVKSSSWLRMSGSTGIESLPTMIPSISDDWFFCEWEKDALGLDDCSPLEACLNHSVFFTAYTEYLR